MPDVEQATEAEQRVYEPDGKTQEQLLKAFTYHPPHPDQLGRYSVIRNDALGLAQLFVRACPPSRERSLALTKLEEAVMWANAAIARNE